MKEVCIRNVHSDDDLRQAFKLREIVFMDEQGISKDIEFDGLDGQCQHLMAWTADRAVGTLRIRRVNDQLAKIERVVVLKSERGRHIGIKLMEAALRQSRESGLRTVKLHAQTHAEAFYERLGFVAHGDIFDEDGIPHVAMLHDLA